MNHARNQDGFALVEVIVSAAVLAIVALAVLSGIDGATASTARERARAVAASLAEQDQERMRSHRFDELSKLVGLPDDDESRNRTIAVDGIEYNVNSEVTFQVDSGATTAGCGAAPKQNDYLRIITTVTSTLVGSRIAPVTLESLVAPPVSGSLVVKVVNAKEEPVSAVLVTTKAKSGREYTGTTNSQGCVPFVGIESGEHTVTIYKAGYVDRTGEERPEKITTVTPSLVNTVTLSYDIAVDLTVNVRTLKPGAPWPSADSYPSKASAVSDNSAETPVLRKYTPATPASTISIPKVFPFLTAYSFFTGTCGIESPVAMGHGDYFSTTNPAAAVLADSTKSALERTATVFQPALNLRIRATSSNANTSNSSSFDATSVEAYLHLQAVDGETCDSPAGTYKVANWDSSPGWGSAPTGKTRNWVVQAGAGFDPGLPFGTYKVCLKHNNRWWTTAGTTGNPHYDNTQPAPTELRELPPSGASWTSRPSGC